MSGTESLRFGEFFAELRRKRLGLSLREFCEIHSFDPGNLSRLERGKMAPPQSRENLERYARALDLSEGSDDWYLFFDLAAAGRGELPADLMETPIAGQLPALFRGLRNGGFTTEKMEEFLETLREI